MRAEVTRVRVVGKTVTRRLVPHRYRPLLRRWYNELSWWVYAGDAVACNCCGGRFRRFRSWSDSKNMLQPMCPRCGSLGRHRVDWLFLSKRTDLLDRTIRLLHVAPEPALQRCFELLPNVSYLSADYDSALAMEQMDITDIEYPDESFDAIVCNHVLEHVEDDLGAMRELCRVLRPDGWALLQVPVDASRAVTFEDSGVTNPRERVRVFGQHDHVRIYGSDYADRLARAGFAVAVHDVVSTVPESDVHELGLDARETIYFCRRADRRPGS
jgi:SAM-dependent methyltransferase